MPVLLTDSLLSVNWITGKARCNKPELQRIVKEIRDKLVFFPSAAIYYINREFNGEADFLAGKGTDAEPGQVREVPLGTLFRELPPPKLNTGGRQEDREETVPTERKWTPISDHRPIIFKNLKGSSVQQSSINFVDEFVIIM